jgi:hypothetical protein
VTREGVHVDRIASAWLIRRFIDLEARFKFVPSRGYVPRAGEIRFDMADAEYTHVGDDCTFQTLVRRFGLAERPLRTIGEIVHDIDCKDELFGRPETAGVETSERRASQASARGGGHPNGTSVGRESQANSTSDPTPQQAASAIITRSRTAPWGCDTAPSRHWRCDGTSIRQRGARGSGSLSFGRFRPRLVSTGVEGQLRQREARKPVASAGSMSAKSRPATP